MRMRYVSVTYQFGGASQSLERHYRELSEELLRQGQHYGLLQGLQGAAQWRPPVDIHETPETIFVKVELAGMREEQMEITLYENALVVTGRRDDDADHEHTLHYHQAQVRYGPFRTEILLPMPVRADEVDATYEEGFLRITLPKVTRGEPGGVRAESSGTHVKGESVPHLNAAPVGGASSASLGARNL